jgi:hypothetical protein
MGTYQYTTTMGIQPTAFVRTVRIRYSFPKGQPSTGGKHDGARRLCDDPIRAEKTQQSQSEQNTRLNRANNLLIIVHCNTAGSWQLRPLRSTESLVQEDEPEKEQRVLSLLSRNRKHSALYLRLVGSAYPLKESYYAKSLLA